MESKNTFMYCFIGVCLFLCACSKRQTDISAICEQSENGNFIIKWEIYPYKSDAKIEIFASDKEDVFDRRPILQVNADKYIVTINKNEYIDYKFFKIKVGNSYSAPFSNRFVFFDKIQNFRDIGGYKNKNGKEVKWGKIYRCGNLSDLCQNDSARLVKMNLKTSVDLRSDKERIAHRNAWVAKQVYNLPVTHFSRDTVYSRILNNHLYKGDARIYIQDLYRTIALDNLNEYAEFINVLLDESNYPVLVNCDLGKDQTGFAMYLVLRLLDVYPGIAEEDFLLSNIGIDKDKLFSGYKGSGLSEQQQLAFSLLGKADISYLKYSIACIRSIYGSFDNYLTEGLGITAEKKTRLQEILLYNDEKL